MNKFLNRLSQWLRATGQPRYVRHFRRLILVLVALVLFIQLSLVYSKLLPSRASKSLRSTPRTDPEILAWVACQEFIKKRLIAPHTATFPRIFFPGITRSGPSRYTVVSYVDSKNRAGIKVRTIFTCELYDEGNKQWILEDLITQETEPD